MNKNTNIPIFKKVKEDCFNVSVSNYFARIGDFDMALKFNKDYWKHPFVGRNGAPIHSGVESMIVREITDNKYVATQYTVHANSFANGEIKPSNEEEEFIFDIYRREYENGFIKKLSRVIISDPVILGYVNNQNQEHAVLYLGRFNGVDFVVDEDRIYSCNLKKFVNRSFMKIKKNI